jgi:tetratricopeptide (TPR) repeat protein
MNPEAEATMTAEEMEFLPNVAGAYMNRAQILIKKGDSEAAIADLSKSIELYPLHPTYQLRATELQKRGNLSGALADLSTSIELQPGNAFAYLDRGALLILMGRDEEAEKDFKRCLELSPDLSSTVDYRRAEAKKQREKSSPGT